MGLRREAKKAMVRLNKPRIQYLKLSDDGKQAIPNQRTILLAAFLSAAVQLAGAGTVAAERSMVKEK